MAGGGGGRRRWGGGTETNWQAIKVELAASTPYETTESGLHTFFDR